jgi:methionyl-tRNA synthetase
MADQNGKFYITTAIPYVNAAPHIGHAMEFVQTDVLARYHKLLGNDVFVTTGADENSLKNVKAAESQNLTTRELVNRNTALFREFSEKIGLSFNVFLRSSDKDIHWQGAQELWRRCVKSGDIYKKSYKGLYCVGCEAFYTEDELDNGICPVHKTKPDLVEEENYFFRLSKYQGDLERILESNEYRVVPTKRKNEILSFVKGGLEDFSVSRSVARAKGWGVPVPDDQSQIMYVWVDALSVYITGVGFGRDEESFKRWWPADVHVIGKDIIRFHAVYWPALLLSAGIQLPKSLFVHGFLTMEGQKMSKSIGNIVSPIELLKQYSSDELRYYLMRDPPTFDDGDFSMDGLKDRINKELLGDLGNLVNRVLTLTEKSGLQSFAGTDELGGRIKLDEIKTRMSEMDIHMALESIMEFVRACNKYVNDKAPWKLAGKELEGVLYNLLEGIRAISILLYPYIPSTCDQIAQKLGTKITRLDDVAFRPAFTEKLSRGGYLFKRV